MEETITIPKWIIAKALDTLSITHRSFTEECCLKRQVASSYNYLSLYYRGNPTDDELEKVAVNYIDGKLGL